MARLELALLGPPKILVNGQPLEVDTRMAVALLAYLALSDQAISRDALATLLWPEYDQANARANLRRTLSVLRRGLGGRWIVVDRDQIGLERSPEEIALDVKEFREAIASTATHGHGSSDACTQCIDPLTRAVELARGPFLAGFTLRESASFDQWQADQAEQHTRELARALDRLTRALASSAQFNRAIGFARRWLSLDPLHEPAHRRLMALHAWAGERGAALRQYRDCVRILDQELGVSPLIETTDLADAIKAGAEPLPTANPAAPPSEGLPLFVVELARALPTDALPPTVRDLLHLRLRGTGEIATQLLTAAAVIGHSFDLEEVRQASGRGEDEAVQGLDELLRQGLIRELSDTASAQVRFDFSHHWFRQIVYDQTSLNRRRLLHRRVAEALSSTNHRGGGRFVGEIALHYQRAGQDATAAEFFRLAGDQARSLYANAEAIAHFRAALALGHPSTAVLHEAIADAETLAGRYAEAVNSYQLAAALCPPSDLARLEHKLGHLYVHQGEWARADRQFASAEAELAEERSADRSRLYADWSLVASRQGDAERASDLAQRALRLAQGAEDAHALMQAHNVMGILANRRGEPRLSHYHLERSLALAEALDDRAGRIAALNNLALAPGATGQVDAALAATSAALELYVDRANPDQAEVWKLTDW